MSSECRLPAGTNVTDLILCEAPNDANICEEDTDLEGVFVNNTSTDCDLANTNFADQCLKCADLAIFHTGGNGPQEDASIDLIGNTTRQRIYYL